MTSKKELYPSIEFMAENIISRYLESNLDERVKGEVWYAQAHEIAVKIADSTGHSLDTVCAVIAALSPRNQWNRNISDAQSLLLCNALEKSYDDVKVCTYNANKDKAIRIIEGSPIDEVLSGLKVNAFYRCIYNAGDTAAVCVDGHAVSIALGERITLDKTPARYFKSVGYYKVSDAYIAACEAINLYGKASLQPCELQAITWLTHRRINEVTKQLSEVSNRALLNNI